MHVANGRVEELFVVQNCHLRALNGIEMGAVHSDHSTAIPSASERLKLDYTRVGCVGIRSPQSTDSTVEGNSEGTDEERIPHAKFFSARKLGFAGDTDESLGRRLGPVDDAREVVERCRHFRTNIEEASADGKGGAP